MEFKNRTYLVDTRNLSPSERARVEELLNISCWLMVPLAKKLDTFMAHTSYSAEEFVALPFPDGCTVTDVTDQDLRVYR